ncbi:DUF3592 domain-containing protein [Cellulomonas cellasea]|uniref:Uncharacterized protein n=1 Tax=Cellulomonas cellasea TaxID=43670 RepID=A0A7W4UJJ4_9CELL|nr:DUF3592 domain-containing protein [Cellulomonas cellasea]MBB2924860.1 hypothetical protein [Cellulomonas cellasea]
MERRKPRGLARQQRRRAAARPGVVTHERALRRARLRVTWWCLRATLGAALLAFTAFALVTGPRVVAEDQRLIDSAPRSAATIVDVRSAWRSTDIEVDVAGRTAVLALGFPGDDRAEVGDVVEVVVDPDDPDVVLPVAAHDDGAYTRAGSAVLAVGLGVLALAVGVPLLLVPGPRELSGAARPRVVQDGTVVEAQGRAVTVEVDGGRSTWSGSDEWHPRRGTPVVVLGDLRDGGLVLLDDGRTRWPAKRLRPADAPGPR